MSTVLYSSLPLLYIFIMVLPGKKGQTTKTKEEIFVPKLQHMEEFFFYFFHGVVCSMNRLCCEMVGEFTTVSMLHFIALVTNL